MAFPACVWGSFRTRVLPPLIGRSVRAPQRPHPLTLIPSLTPPPPPGTSLEGTNSSTADAQKPHLDFPYLTNVELSESQLPPPLPPPPGRPQSGRHCCAAQGHSRRNRVSQPHQNLSSFEALTPSPLLLNWYIHPHLWFCSELPLLGAPALSVCTHVAFCPINQLPTLTPHTYVCRGKGFPPNACKEIPRGCQMGSSEALCTKFLV